MGSAILRFAAWIPLVALWTLGLLVTIVAVTAIEVGGVLIRVARALDVPLVRLIAVARAGRRGPGDRPTEYSNLPEVAGEIQRGVQS